MLFRSTEELSKKIFASWEERQAEDFVKLPVKELQYNRCPAVAPLGVLEQGDGWRKISLSAEVVQQHQHILLNHPDFAEKLGLFLKTSQHLRNCLTQKHSCTMAF